MTKLVKKSIDADKLTGNDEIATEGFSSWLNRIRESQKTGEAVNVPCGDCTACCTSSYFIHIKPGETGTISKIPGKLMFPAPGLPKGNLLLGFDKKGRCPMFINNLCSVYDNRPETCRTYDCRIFTATGLQPGDDKALISRQVKRWKFKFENDLDLCDYSAVHNASGFITRYAGSFPAGFIPINIPQQAMIAIKTYEVFLKPECINIDKEEIRISVVEEIVKSIIEAYKKF